MKRFNLNWIKYSILLSLLGGCASVETENPADVYEPNRPGPVVDQPISNTTLNKRIENVSIEAYRLSEQLRRTKVQGAAAQRRKEIETRLRGVDFEIMRLKQKPTIPQGELANYARKVSALEQEMRQLWQILGTL